MSIEVKFLTTDTNMVGAGTFVASSNANKKIDLSEVTSASGEKLGAKIKAAAISTIPGLTRKHVLADIDRFQFNIRNILISKYPSLKSSETLGGVYGGSLDEAGSTYAYVDAGGPTSYLNHQVVGSGDILTKGRYVAKGMENWITTQDKGNRLRDGNVPLQLDVSKGWVSILGKDNNNEDTITVERKKTASSLSPYEKPAPGTYHHIAIVLNKWHKVGMEMNIGNSGTGNRPQKLVTSGDLALEAGLTYGVWPPSSSQTYLNSVAVGLRYQDAINESPTFGAYKNRIAQKLEKVDGAVTADHSGLTMANNHFTNRNFTGNKHYKFSFAGATASTALNINNSDGNLKVGDCVVFINKTTSPTIPTAQLKNGGTYFVHTASGTTAVLSTSKGGTAIALTNGNGSNNDYLIKHTHFRKELETYPEGSNDIGCMFLAREKFNHFQTSGVTIEGGLTFAYNHKILKGTKVQYTDNSAANIPELVSGNEYYVLEGSSGLTTGKKEEGDFSGGARAKHVKLSLTKNGPAIPINDGSGAANNKLRMVRPLAYDEVDWLMHDLEVVPNGQHSTDSLVNMKFEPVVLVKKLNPPLVITKKTRDIKITWKMGGAAHLNLWKESLDDWEDDLDGAKVSGTGLGGQGQGVNLNLEELNFSVKAI